MSNHDASLAEIKSLAEAATESYDHYLAHRRERDESICEAIEDGVTMYRIAKATGLSEQAVRKIRDR